MKCWKCGNELEENQRFCHACGAEQAQQSGPEPAGGQAEENKARCWKCGNELEEKGQLFCGVCGAKQTQSQQPGPTPTYTPGGPPTADRELILKIFSGVCAVVYALMTLGSLGNALQNLIGLPSVLMHFGLSGFLLLQLVLLVISLGLVVAGVLMCAVLVLTILKRTANNSDTLLIGLCLGGVMTLVLRLVQILLLLQYPGSNPVSDFVVSLLGVAFTIAGVYLIRRFLLGEEPLKGKNLDQIRWEASETLSALRDDLVKGRENPAQNAQPSQPTPPPQGGQFTQPSQPTPPPQGDQFTQPSQPTPPPFQGTQPTPPPQPVQQPQGGPGASAPNYGPFSLKTNRSLLVYILLGIVTCGIYQLYFLYTMARDTNIVCNGDGQKTSGLLALILLSLITCGLYGIYWYYSLGNRLASNAPRYGLTFQENGTTILLWYLVGLLLCGIGPLVAMHILIKNLNSLCASYNAQILEFSVQT